MIHSFFPPYVYVFFLSDSCLLYADGKPSGKILNLGTYNNDYEWPEEDGGGGTGGGTGGVGVGVGVGEDGSGPDPKHHSQFYANGTECDLTGNMRKTEVKVRYTSGPV